MNLKALVELICYLWRNKLFSLWKPVQTRCAVVLNNHIQTVGGIQSYIQRPPNQSKYVNVFITASSSIRGEPLSILNSSLAFWRNVQAKRKMQQPKSTGMNNKRNCVDTQCHWDAIITLQTIFTLIYTFQARDPFETQKLCSYFIPSTLVSC